MLAAAAVTTYRRPSQRPDSFTPNEFSDDDSNQKDHPSALRVVIEQATDKPTI